MGASFIVAWGFGWYAPEAASGMGRDPEKALGLRLRRPEALARTPLHEKITALIPSGPPGPPDRDTPWCFPPTGIRRGWPPLTEGLHLAPARSFWKSKKIGFFAFPPPFLS